MQMRDNTILITGGASGIGNALAKRFLAMGNTVIICGRRKDKLREAKSHNPNLHIRTCDVSVEEERVKLAEWITNEFPKLNVLVNNAGIQQKLNLTSSDWQWSRLQNEIDINFAAPIHLSMLFAQQLAKQANPAIINVSSGLAFAPMAAAPVYCATKAGLHSFSVSLRIQLKAAGVEVIEIIPPAVNTDLGVPGTHTFGAPLDEFADAVFAELATGKQEIGYGYSASTPRMSRDEIDAATIAINQRVAIPS